MRVPRIIPVFVCVLFAANVAFAKVRIDYDHGTNFYKYKTFMWQEKPKTDDPFMEDRIMSAVNGQLQAKGLRRVTSDADLIVSVTSSVEEKQSFNTYYNGGWGWGPGWGWSGWGWGWGWDGPGWATTYPYTYLEGTTVVNLIDTASEKTIWRGVGKSELSDKPAKASKKTTKNIAKMFKKYPPGRDD